MLVDIMDLFALHIFILSYVCLHVLNVNYTADAFTCKGTSEVFARVNGTVRFDFSVKGQIEGVTTFEFIGPNGTLGQFSYNSKSNVLSIQNTRDVEIDAYWNGNVQITKSHVASRDIGLYSLEKVGREFRECSFLFILDRPEKPIIISEYTTVGENSTLICNSSSTTYPSNHSLGLIYSWLVNNDTDITRTFFTISGNQLIITNLTESDARLEYTCVATENVTNGYSSVISNQFSFNITYGPDENTTTISPPWSLYTLDEGTVLEDINCTGICFPMCYYQWVKVEYNSTTVVVNDSGVLSLGVLDRDEAARYICTVSNPVSKGNVTVEVLVNVTYAPDVSIRMSSTDFTEGANITLLCEASGVPSNYSYMAFTQTWNGMEIHNTHTELPGTTTHSSIHIPSLQLRDSGTYTCTVNNGIVDRNGVLDQNASASIHVKVLPKVITENLTFFGTTGGPASVMVTIYSDPEIDSVRFIRNGNFSSPFDTKYVISYQKVSLNVTLYDKNVNMIGDEIRITANNFTEDDFGNYTLVLRNNLGQTAVTVVILPESEPLPPKIFILRWRKSTPILLWAKNHNGGHEQSFVIQTSKDGETDWSIYRIIHEDDDLFKINGSFYMANITDLNQGSYRVRILATNKIGDSKPVYLNSSFAVGTIGKETGSKVSKLNSTAVIIGTSSGIFLVITVVSVVVVVIYKRRNKRKSEGTDECAPYNTLERPKENDYEEPASYASLTVYACAATGTSHIRTKHTKILNLNQCNANKIASSKVFEKNLFTIV